MGNNNIVKNSDEIKKNILIPSDINKIKFVREHILQDLNKYCFNEEVKMAILVALDECLTNAIKHGNKNNNKLMVEINYKINKTSIIISIKDQGSGFNWKENIHFYGQNNYTGYETSGRGIFMIKNLMSDVFYNDLGNEITIVKNFTN